MRGMHALYDEYQPTADAFVDVLGDGHTVTFGALSIHWHKISASGPGAHTLCVTPRLILTQSSPNLGLWDDVISPGAAGCRTSTRRSAEPSTRF